MTGKQFARQMRFCLNSSAPEQEHIRADDLLTEAVLSLSKKSDKTDQLRWLDGLAVYKNIVRLNL